MFSFSSCVFRSFSYEIFITLSEDLLSLVIFGQPELTRGKLGVQLKAETNLEQLV